jgi:D-sedoheptulose 7-phosphate isomerase
MREVITRSLRAHQQVAAALLEACAPALEAAAGTILASLRSGGKLLAMGNGGSAADAQHLVAELVGRYRVERTPLPALALTTDPSVVTALGNDYGFEEIFARQVRAHVRRGDVVVALSTSGNSENVRRGLAAGRDGGAATIALLGGSGGRLRGMADVELRVPSEDTARVQEAHITLLHVLCELIDRELGAP